LQRCISVKFYLTVLIHDHNYVLVKLTLQQQFHMVSCLAAQNGYG
jgi:hypothetical protein